VPMARLATLPPPHAIDAIMREITKADAKTSLKFRSGFQYAWDRIRSARTAPVAASKMNGIAGVFVGDGMCVGNVIGLAARAVVETVTWNGIVAFAETLNDVGTAEQAAPTGAPVQDSVTGPVKPLRDWTSSWYIAV
jgi:hypothetical protein